MLWYLHTCTLFFKKGRKNLNELKKQETIVPVPAFSAPGV